MIKIYISKLFVVLIFSHSNAVIVIFIIFIHLNEIYIFSNKHINNYHLFKKFLIHEILSKFHVQSFLKY